MDCCVFNPDMVLTEEALFGRALATHADCDKQPTLTAYTSHFRKPEERKREAAAGTWWERVFRRLCVDG